MKKSFCLLTLAAALAIGCSRGPVKVEEGKLEPLRLEKVEMVIPPPPPPPQAPPAPARSERMYVVQKGDTLWHIAKKFYGDGRKWKLIIQANNITGPARLKIGQKLIIP